MRLSSKVVASLFVSSALASPAFAQLAQPAPLQQNVDKNGVNLFDGNLYANGPVLSMGQGQPQGVQFYKVSRNGGWTDNVIAGLDLESPYITASFSGHTDVFSVSGSTYTNTQANGATLTLASGIYTYIAADGTVVHFDSSKATPSPYYANAGRPIDITYPTGAKLTFTYQSVKYCHTWKSGQGGNICTALAYMYRPTSAQNNYGYQLTFGYDPAYDYVYDPTEPEIQPEFYGWSQSISVSATNLAVASGASTSSQSWSNVGSYFQVTDPMGRVTKYRMSGYQVLGITLPGSTSEDETINYTSGRVTSVVTPAGTTTYSSSDLSNVRTVTVTDPLSHVTTYKFDIPSQTLTSVTDPNSHTTTATYDSYGRITQITKPEGNYTKWTYDGRGNVTEQRQVAKAGSGLADIVLDANYDSTCTNYLTCNQPHWTKDALGNETDYTYDSTSGSLLTVTRPAPTTGAVRPQTRYSYTSLQAYFKNSSGSIVASGQPVVMLTGISACQTTASCTGTSDETKASINYGPQTTGIGNNLLPVSVSQGDGTGALTATTAYTYDDVGNLTYTDGPLPGTADTTRALYDADREQIGRIDPDPDGAGPLQNRAIRNTIDSRGLLTRVELGTTNGQTDAAWSAFATAQQVDITYDTRRRISTRQLSSGGTAYALTQNDYYADDSLQCTAIRMNTAVYGSLPSSACTQSTAGSYGPDRITKNVYDPAGQLTQSQLAVGTSDAANERTLSYTNNGMLQTLIDGENNKTTYVYDGFDRLSQTQYPSPTKGSGTSNPSDYEQLTYDANSNVTQGRVRSGATINFAYDNLSRLTSKTSSALPEVDYTYDLLDRGLTAKFTSGQGITNAYDALGRLTSTSSNVGGTAHALTYQYDLAGNRTQMNWWDGFYVNYDRLVTGEISAARENGAVSGVGVLATYAYDNLRRRTSVTFGNGAVQSYSYDPVSHLSQLTNDLSGTANDLTETFTYSPAFQVVSTTRTGDAYAYTAMGNGTTAYTSNGLNQQVSIGGSTATWDSNGNLATEPQSGKTYTYDIEDKLTASTGGTATSLAYDPLDRVDTYNPGTLRRFVYDGTEAVAELDSSGTIQNRYVRGDGADELLVDYSGSGTTSRRFTSADERGSIISLTDSSGNLVGIDRYDEYGKPQPTNIGRFQYTGQAWLSEANVAYYKGRTYLPHLGIFGETDPAGYADSANLYAYVLNDPVNRIDPSGMDAFTPPINCIGWSWCGPLSFTGSRCSAGAICFSPSILSGVPSNGGPSAPREPGDKNGGGSGGKHKFTCADALKQSGKIRARLISGGLTGVLGWTAGTGTWTNLSTGAQGSFTTFGFSTGISAGLSEGTQTWSSLSAFNGSSDSFTIAVSLISLGPIPMSIGGEYSRGWNAYGSGTGKGASFGPSVLFRATAQTAWTTTQISNCKPGEGNH